MKDYTPDSERENEALWGNKDGYEAMVKQKLKGQEDGTAGTTG